MALTLQSSQSANPHVLPEVGAILAAVLDAKERTRTLVDSPRLTATIDAMVARAHALGASTIYGASDIGHFLCGAMACRSDRLQLWVAGDASPVFLIDGVVAGLAGLQVAAEQLSVAGANCADDALVLGVTAPGTAGDECVGCVVALSTLPAAA